MPEIFCCAVPYSILFALSKGGRRSRPELLVVAVVVVFSV
jgi:hypothetical protein